MQINKWQRIGLSLGILVIVLVLWQGGKAVSEPNAPYNNGRFGFGLTGTGGAPSNYDIASLNGGFYWDWGARHHGKIAGYEYMKTIRLNPVKSGSTQTGYTASPTGTTLLNSIAAQPGATWLIGNEPDCVNMDNMRSEWYARAYHDMYHLIKQADPTAKIGAGSIVQPTPQRLMYLDRVLTEYQFVYGEPLPTDLWVTHAYILCENCYPHKQPGEPFAWGACWVPDWPSQTASAPYATFYSVYDHWNMDIFSERLITMRQWMYDNGYRNHPLIITEYGVLFYKGLVSGMTTQDDIDFMNAGFDWLRTATDPVLGYAPDAQRLVQRWAWFSLDHDGWYLGGALFDYETHQPLALGTAFGQYTAQVPPMVDLQFLDQQVVDATITSTMQITISNAGNITSNPLTDIFFFEASDPSDFIAHTPLPQLQCCGDHTPVEAIWPNRPADAEFCALGLEEDVVVGTSCSDLRVGLHIMGVNVKVAAPPDVEATAAFDVTIQNRGSLETSDVVSITISDGVRQHTGTASAVPCCGAQTTGTVQWPNYQSDADFTVWAETATYTATDPISVALFSQLVIQKAWAPIVDAPAPTTATLYAQVSNIGSLSINHPITLSFYVSTSTILQPITTTIRPLNYGGDYVTASVVWPYLADGYHGFRVEATTVDDQTAVASAGIWINPLRYYAPLVLKH